MWAMLWPLVLIIGSNCLYNISTKSMPSDNDSFGLLFITYVIGGALTLIMYVMNSGRVQELGRNFSVYSLLLGVAIVGLETGYIYLYRAGWQISRGAMTANTCLAVALLFIGKFMYGEDISLRQVCGVFVCLGGLYLMKA